MAGWSGKGPGTRTCSTQGRTGTLWAPASTATAWGSSQSSAGSCRCTSPSRKRSTPILALATTTPNGPKTTRSHPALSRRVTSVPRARRSSPTPAPAPTSPKPRVVRISERSTRTCSTLAAPRSASRTRAAGRRLGRGTTRSGGETTPSLLGSSRAASRTAPTPPSSRALASTTPGRMRGRPAARSARSPSWEVLAAWPLAAWRASSPRA
mmetsp:Transcript_25884/g.74200  ORF Transcript_25884/g.74200 Transcript_25884/m.74200 type:complete len:210 (+) Transcript_25884:529-1158(+)